MFHCDFIFLNTLWKYILEIKENESVYLKNNFLKLKYIYFNKMYLYNILFPWWNQAFVRFNFLYIFVFLYRNLSSVNEKTRKQIRETNGLIEALVYYIQKCLQDTKVEEKVIV